jgi:hypothetical protein
MPALTNVLAAIRRRDPRHKRDEVSRTLASGGASNPGKSFTRETLDGWSLTPVHGAHNDSPACASREWPLDRNKDPGALSHLTTPKLDPCNASLRL